MRFLRSIGFALALLLSFSRAGTQPEPPGNGEIFSSEDTQVIREEDYGPITSLRELRQLSPQEAALGLPVDVTGVITYAEIPRNIVFVQNEDGAAYVNIRTENGRIAGKPGLSLQAGDRVRLRGITHPGGFTPSIWYPEGGNVRINKLGKAPLPRFH